uniref:Protein kinase domain-containing protein n=1 Tax=Meloidogyne incognita TaxID=6306 RepID=A0A914NDR6_MELIC
MGNRNSSIRHQGLLCPSETDLTDFQISKFIGIGTFGKVYVVYHKGLKKEYALKIMQKRRICKYKFVENILNELNLLQGLTHPFICSLWYAFQDSDQIYMISDLLPGGDLAYHLKNQGRFSESRAKLLFCELALALDYLHRQRIGHFDVKPANILLDEKGHSHLSDFSLAKKLSKGELANTLSGTHLYMAPEIYLTFTGNIKGYDWRVDWWALGVCFYEMLRGRTPYEYPSTFSSLQALNIIYTRSVTMPSRWPSDLISFLRAIINPDQTMRVENFENVQNHVYMERINWKNVFDRKMIPIFVPPKERLESFGRRNYRATISVPFSRSQQHNKLKYLPSKEKGASNEAVELTQSNELLNEIANLTIKFKMFNRFRCETQIAEPRQSLDIVANKEKKLLSRKPTQLSIINKEKQQKPLTGRPLTQADKLRKAFQTANQDVNYSI